MYWTKYGSGSTGGIFKSEMDGSNAAEIVSGLQYPAGIAIDFDSSRLFWADYNTGIIQSSNLDGTDVQLVVQLSGGTLPWGIAITGDRLFWGTYIPNSLQSSDKSGQDIMTLYNGTYTIRHLTFATANPAQTRPNHCEGQTCYSGICVLNKGSFRCVE